MAIADELHGFVRESLSRGRTRSEIETALTAAGWTPEQVKAAMREFAEVDFPVPVPRPRPYLTAREAFLYLVLFGSLYLSAFNLGNLVFQLINHTLPDPGASVRAAATIREAIRWSISTLIVAFPVFLYVAQMTRRETRAEPAKRASKVRRWLTYLTLFIAGSVLIGDVTSLVFNLLGGDLTTRFLLKVLTIGAIAGSIFFYYLRDLRIDDEDSSVPGDRNLGIAAIAVVVVAMVGGMIVIGSPGEQRALRLDARRVQDLRSISAALDLYSTRRGQLPPSLDVLASQAGVNISMRDPEGVPYGYQVVSDTAWELCANFDRSMMYPAEGQIPRARGEVEVVSEQLPDPDDGKPAQRKRSAVFWSHGTGRQCFVGAAERLSP